MRKINREPRGNWGRKSAHAETGTRFSKVPKLLGCSSSDIILFVSSKQRRLEARNFAVIWIFIPFTTYEKTASQNERVGVLWTAFRARFSKVPELFGHEKPFVKLRPAYSVKLVFSDVVKWKKNQNNCRISWLEMPSFWRYKENYLTRKGSGPWDVSFQLAVLLKSFL